MAPQAESKPPLSMITSRTRVYLQEACLRHQYIRSKDVSLIVERPQRLRAINVGVSAITARLESPKSQPSGTATRDQDDLADALGKISLDNNPHLASISPIEIVKSTARVDVLNHAAVKFVHGDIGGDIYLENLIKWAKDSREKISQDGCEIPEGMSKGDLYLCPTSMEAIQGALGTVCEAVDDTFTATSASRQAFVAVRPPGHHCGEDTPSGFCFVNNVVVGAAHAHLQYGVKRVVVFDIDLHHGNGTQSLIWQINEEAYRLQSEEKCRLAGLDSKEKPKQGLQVYYGSVHDILSYPCEDGNPAVVQAASVSIHGPHGQYVENIHLVPYSSEGEFWSEHYEKQYAKIISKAAEFLESTASEEDSDALIFVSCGFDASEHEYPSMSRHGRHVPTSFYRRFARDALSMAHKYAQGRLISVLEGGYSDRALTSGVMSWLAGMTEGPTTLDAKPTKQEPNSKPLEETASHVDERWWSVENLVALEQATQKRAGGRASLGGVPPEDWLQRTLEIFSSIDVPPPRTTVPTPATARKSLRDRSKKSQTKREVASGSSTNVTSAESSAAEEETHHSDAVTPMATKKLPRVILKLGPPRET